ncbi:hypothetical protein [Paenibacillus wynnii]|uniref:hypothetical protein n=1 Tax=Paenibacillus wynnii TaxID=268407 RepID=UPI0027D83294|nr:hypothetical protein [Paenibacillus wynnii]
MSEGYLSFRQPDPTKPTFTEEEIIGISNGKEKPISLGMHRETVEATNGKPDGQLSYMVDMDTTERYPYIIAEIS